MTGASRGIGRATALLLGELGAKVAVNYIKSAEAAQEVVDEIEAGSSPRVRSGQARAVAIQADVRDKTQVGRLATETREALGKIDALVCNAGTIEVVEWETMTLEHWEEMLRSNATSAMLCCQTVMPEMIEQEYGRIVLLSSVAAERGSFLSAGYAAAKAALLGLMHTLVRTGGPHNVTVNTVLPGVIETDMVDGWLTDDMREMIISGVPANRFGAAEDVAAAVAFLASTQAGFVSGVALDVNGGSYMR